ncbi:1,2-epoxyphenylacetyl-CoA isomerase [bacterium HR41]|nr:1,2-epoxyphenylacetyl-CoA isomerase [bacterium HR41]
MSERAVLWSEENGVATITLNRPERLNAWTEELADELRECLRRAGSSTSVRSVLITGAGRAFSSGADLKAGFEAADDGMPDIRRELDERYHPLIAAVRRLDKPVVAAVNGPAVGIGASLALACDLVTMAESAFISLAFVEIGLAPDGGSTLLVPAAVGKARAFQMALLAERVPARQALEWGLVNFVYPDGELADRARDLAERLARGPTRAYAAVKRALNESLFANLDRQLRLEADLHHDLARSEDFLEGVRAFIEKREPAFKGA